MKAKVTIGVCVRNCSATVRRAIESIMVQDYPHELMEVIFVDDGSTDDTLAVIEEYMPKMDIDVKVFHHKWRGLGFSRNVVVKNATGKYIVWVDGDMILPRDHVKKQVKYMEENPKVAIGKGRYELCETDNLVAFLENITHVLEFLNNEWRADEYKPLGTGGAIYRVDAIQEIGGFNENICGAGEDMDVEFKVKNNGWMLGVTTASFYEIRRQNFRDLWNEYFWHGLGAKSVIHSIKRARNILFRMFPPYTVLFLLKRSILGYKVVRKKKVFLLPFHWFFKRIAWLLGFIHGHFKSS